MATIDKAIRLEAEADKLATKIDALQEAYTDDLGNWTSRKAKKEFRKLTRALERVDREYNRVCS